MFSVLECMLNFFPARFRHELLTKRTKRSFFFGRSLTPRASTASDVLQSVRANNNICFVWVKRPGRRYIHPHLFRVNAPAVVDADDNDDVVAIWSGSHARCWSTRDNFQASG